MDVTVDPVLAAKFWAKVKKRPGDDCWQWMGSLHRTGYGRFHTVHNTYLLAHIFAWEIEHGPYDHEALCLVELPQCNNRGCVRPDHRQLVSVTDARGRKSGYALAKDPAAHVSMFPVKQRTELANGQHVFVAASKVVAQRDAQAEAQIAAIMQGFSTMVKALRAVDGRIAQLRDATASLATDEALRELAAKLAHVDGALAALALTPPVPPMAEPEPGPTPSPPPPREPEPTSQPTTPPRLRELLARLFADELGVPEPSSEAERDELEGLFDRAQRLEAMDVSAASLRFRSWLLTLRALVQTEGELPTVEALERIVARDTDYGHLG